MFASDRGDEPSSTPHIVFERLHKRYDGPQGPIHAVHDVSFAIARGEVFGIIGRSGAGKSTLLRTINALEVPDAGTVTVDDVPVAGLDEAALVRLRRRIGMIFQHFNLLSSKTVNANVALPLRVAGLARPAIDRRVGELLDLVGLSDKASAYPSQLSGGQKQRVGIARALVHQPEILLCDEATSALDPETTQSILALLRDINRRLGLTVVLITHDMAVIREICDRVLVLDQGRRSEMGEVWRIFGDPAAEATRALLRPLLHDLPADLARDLVDDLGGRPGEAILQLRYGGDSSADGVALADLAALHPQARLLHGGLDRIRGHSQGRLLVAIPASALDPVQDRTARVADHIEVLGYVVTGAR
ncbi:ATP-binding cassette domain-containing protein [Siculibacillus lacustris]|uniref:Cell division ATP-binding protein FtsE n=1 Tax=Siculibacillus lacustris TaxID=1549641 RepID=A0A4Q9VJJ8_9HYPH|nr:ATP-binding cassette domain-containing protein [Siculibacillus lacustris]TBW35517.1 ATP-binding cassette domain-containing protein [Siculibacillus lacustris]